MNNAYNKTTEQVANEIAAEIANGYKGEFLAMIVAHCSNVNPNKASAALRRCVKMGLIEVLPNSARGPKVYRVVAPVAKVTPPTFCTMGKSNALDTSFVALCATFTTTAKWSGIETSHRAFFKSLN
jgi:hypothetical protein